MAAIQDIRGLDKGIDAMRYGAMTEIDARVMDSVFARFNNSLVRVLEIGVWKGDTARGMKSACDQNGCTIDYWGIDAQRHADPDPPFEGAHYLIHESDEGWRYLFGNFDVVFVDGCHCRNHVILDAVNYSRLVSCGGFMVFHDTAPQIQMIQKNPWVHAEDNHSTRTDVRSAISALGWPNREWRFFADECDEKSDIGGMMVFRKT